MINLALANHGIIRTAFEKITFVRSQVVGISGTDPGVINVSGGAAADGRFMVMLIGGVQTRTVTPPIGWGSYHIPSVGSAGTSTIMWKAALSESGSYSIDLSSSMTPGAIYYAEFLGVDLVNPLAFNVGSSTSSPASSRVSPNFSFTFPGLAFSGCQHDSVTPQWTPNNSFNLIAASSPVRAAYRIYNEAALSQNVTWSGFSSTASKVGVVGFNAKRI